MSATPAVWFPTVRTGTGTDVFTERLAAGLSARGIRAEVTWLPLRAEYAPWTVAVPPPPPWANIVHVNTWLQTRFIPPHLPVVATLHHSIHDPTLRPYKGWLRAAYHRYWIAPNERRVLRRAERVVTVSRFVADIARHTLANVPMQVIYNGVDIQRFRPGRRVRRPGEPFRLLYVGSWMARKGVDLLGPIMRELGHGFELRYTGGPFAKKSARRMPSNTHDIGRLASESAVIHEMHVSDGFLFPSRSEGFGLVVAEAMACGIPVIATRGSSLCEVVDDSLTGKLCTPNSVGAFAEAVRIIACEPPLARSMARNARSRAVTSYSFHGMLDEYVSLYLACVTRPSAN